MGSDHIQCETKTSSPRASTLGGGKNQSSVPPGVLTLQKYMRLLRVASESAACCWSYGKALLPSGKTHSLTFGAFNVKIIFLDLVLGIVFFIQTGAGILGNFFLLCHYIIGFLNRNRLRPIDSIFFHLALANSIVLISKGVPQTMASLGLKNFLDRMGCKLILFLHRVVRNVSLAIACFLSGFQIIIISPIKFSLWPKLKTQASDYIIPFCLSCWILHILMNSFMLINMEKFMERSNNTKIWNIRFCTELAPASFKLSVFVIVYCIPNFLCVGFMVMASGYLMLLLQRHHQQVQHIHSSNQLSRRSPEIRATCTIFVLVSTYVSFYSVNSLLSFFLFFFDKYYQWLIPTSALLAACFRAISPFVLISQDSQILNFFYSLWGKKRFQESLFP
ncbi:LOW QUALITY PROTEIN: vomeronasal type-1 receptor 3-like [Notamacropus eugenii]|uniref:LOW QUALITY PROTEIN: vomeronasal type-1 receptor 3-like n=1 Tax=Notamacropus eugenii TaxID=9315 RepID=UPI003B672012